MPPEPAGRAEAIAAAVAGLALAGGFLFARQATPLPASTFEAVAAALVAWGLAPALHRALGQAAATTARGLGLAAAALLAMPVFGPDVGEMAVPLALGLVGIALLQARHRGGAPAALVPGGVLLVLLGLVVAWQAAAFLPETTRLRTTLVAVAVAGVCAPLARHLLEARGRKALAPTPVGLAGGTALATVYVVYRPLAAARVENLPLYEWTLAAGAAALLLARLHRAAGTPVEPWTGDASRHAQDVRPLYDARMAPMAAVFTRWLETGEGYDEYLRTIEAAAGPLPEATRAALAQARRRPALTPKARRAARETRHAAHREAVAAAIRSRGTIHGNAQPVLRQDP